MFNMKEYSSKVLNTEHLLFNIPEHKLLSDDIDVDIRNDDDKVNTKCLEQWFVNNNLLSLPYESFLAVDRDDGNFGSIDIYVDGLQLFTIKMMD